MNDKTLNIDLNGVLDAKTSLKLSGVKMGDDLKSTIDLNISRVNKNTGAYYTPTLIIFQYVRFVNYTTLDGVNDKKEYVSTAKKLLKELNELGFVIGAEWIKKSNQLPYSKGNSKLADDTVIINLSPASLCISSNLHLCELCDGCYALSSERRYLNTLIYRLTQLIRFDELSIDEITAPFLRMRKINYLRVNEAGDIYDMRDFYKILSIAKILWDKKGVRTYLYTHRRDLWDELKSHQTPFLKVNRSGVDFNASPIISNHHNTLYCDGDCNDCLYCKMEFDISILAPYHGDLICEDLRDDYTIKRDKIIKNMVYEMFESYVGLNDLKWFVNSMLCLPSYSKAYEPYEIIDALNEMYLAFDVCDYCGECYLMDEDYKSSLYEIRME